MSDNISRDDYMAMQEELQRAYAEKMQNVLAEALEKATPARDEAAEKRAERHWLAGLAMQGICAHYGFRISTQAIAEQSWKTADALLSELAKGDA